MKIERPTRRRRGRPPGAKTKRATGAHSRIYRTGNLGQIDRRTIEGRYLARVKAELTEHVGGHPSVTQRMLIERAAVLSLRLMQIDKKIFDCEEFTTVDNNMTIAWSNCLTRTLSAIGIHPEAARNGPTTSFDAVLKELGGGYADAAD